MALQLPPSKSDGMIITLEDTSTASPALLDALKSHLPFSLPVFRRIQFAQNFPRKGSTPFTHILYAFYKNVSDDDNQKGLAGNDRITGTEEGRNHFVAAYVDLSRHPETQAWFYSTLEDFYPDPTAKIRPASIPTEKDISQSDALILATLKRINKISVSKELDFPRHNNYSFSGQGGAGAKEGEPEKKRTDAQLQQGGQHTVLIGSLHESIRQRMLTGLGLRMSKTRNVSPDLEWEFCHKWLFRVEDFPSSLSSSSSSSSSTTITFPTATELLEQGTDGNKKLRIRFDTARREDMDLICSRTFIDRKAETLLKLPSTVVRLVNDPNSESEQVPGHHHHDHQNKTDGDDDKNPTNGELTIENDGDGKGTAIAWAFLGLDGTLITLHVEEGYRGLGLAKTIARQIMRNHLGEYGGDGWGAADVFVSNTESQRVCRSIGGKVWWTLSWAILDLEGLETSGVSLP